MCSMVLSLVGRNLLVLWTSPSLVCVNVYPCHKKAFLPPFVACLHVLVRRDTVFHQWHTVCRSLWRMPPSLLKMTRFQTLDRNSAATSSRHLNFNVCFSPTAIQVPGAKTKDSMCQSSNFRQMVPTLVAAMSSGRSSHYC